MGDRVLTFSVSGMLYKNALLMFDVETSTIWSHVTGEALAGPLVGDRLESVAALPRVSWQAVREAYPDVQVLSVQGLQTASSDTYAAYKADPNEWGKGMAQSVDGRLPGKALVVGIRNGEAALAVPWASLQEGRTVNAVLGDQALVVAIDEARGTSVAYDRRVAGRTLEFAPRLRNGRLRDVSTGTTWELISGRGVSGPMKGERLQSLHYVNAYWFAWSDFYPDTELLHP